MQPGFDLLADQAAMHRVRVAVNVDQAALVHPHLQPQATVQPPCRERTQCRQLLRMSFPPARVTLAHYPLEKCHVFLAAVEIPAATQEQGLVHGRLEVPVGRFTVAVLVRLADVDPLALEAIVVQQPPIAGLKLAFCRQVVDRRAQAVAAMPSRHSAQFPEGVLKAVGQGFEGLRRAQGHRLPVRIREHEVIRQMLESPTEEGDSQGVHAGEVRGRQIAGVMHLAEHDRAPQAGHGPPLPHASLERAALAIQKLSGMLLPQPVEQRLGPQAGLRFQPRLDQRPQIPQRILARPIGAGPLLGAGQAAQQAILACRLLVHPSPPGRDRQPFRLHVPKQLPYLSIRDHRNLLYARELRICPGQEKPGILIVADTSHREPPLWPAQTPRTPGFLIVAGREM